MPSDALTFYRMTRLLRLGATGSYAQSLDEGINHFLDETNVSLNEDGIGLSPQALQEADTWALTQYQKFFSSNPTLDATPRLCGEF